MNGMSLLINSILHGVLAKVLIQHREYFLFYSLFWAHCRILGSSHIHENWLRWEATSQIWILRKRMWYRLLSGCLMLLPSVSLLLRLSCFKYLIYWHLCDIPRWYLFLWTLLKWRHHLNLIELLFRSHCAMQPEIDRRRLIRIHLSIWRCFTWQGICERVLVALILKELCTVILCIQLLLVLEENTLFLHAFIHLDCSLLTSISWFCLNCHIFKGFYEFFRTSGALLFLVHTTKTELLLSSPRVRLRG